MPGTLDAGQHLPQGLQAAFRPHLPLPGQTTKAILDLPGESQVSVECETDGRLVHIAFRDASPEVLRDTILELTASTMAQGVLVHDRKKILLANDRLVSLLEAPAELFRIGLSWKGIIEFGIERGDYGTEAAGYIERILDNFEHDRHLTLERRVAETVLLIEARYEAGIGVVTYTDVTVARLREEQLKRSEARARFLADNDGLTGLLNRRAFDARLDSMISAWRSDAQAGGILAVILLDLDRFKAVNDSHGHGMGDFLLTALARRFADAIGEGNVAARIGGDEFAFALTCRQESQVFAIAETIRAAAVEPVVANGTQVEVGASVGVALALGGMTKARIMYAADLALYSAKKQGRGQIVRFTSDIEKAARARTVLESDLRRAFERAQLEMHYQVQHELRTNQPVGYEALMRWRHPERGLVSPADFIPLAEETGLIVAMGRWALMRSTCDIASLDDRMRISVNVSPVQFAASDIVADVDAALQASGLDPARLEIEITEAVLLRDTDATLATMNRLHERGVTLSLDDFGAGYSSLSYLTHFPFTKIKVDRSFVEHMHDDPRSEALVRSILALAKSLNLKVTAEGVETHSQLLTLAKEGCDEAQGYLLGKPLPLADIGTNLKRRSCT
ncbi:EAL domain-containing protein [Fulvimarina sp. MAC8]|uniref:putative bifunctional diguanylate cyclase/phosphodiesterase n=1 Tax=Fulvimarina sp. MAC8 TaxID=3162874 RepID=UPI0032ED7038